MLVTDRIKCLNGFWPISFVNKDWKIYLSSILLSDFFLKMGPASQTLGLSSESDGPRLLTQFTAAWTLDFSCFSPLYGSSPMCFQLTVVWAKESAQSSSPVIIRVSNECFTSSVWFGVRTVWRRRWGIHISHVYDGWICFNDQPQTAGLGKDWNCCFE